MQHALLRHGARIVRARVGALVFGQWRARVAARVAAVLLVVARLPLSTPVLAPARRPVRIPAAPVTRVPVVIADRHPEHVSRYVNGIHVGPWAVVPGARVPTAVVVVPVQAVGEEIIR